MTDIPLDAVLQPLQGQNLPFLIAQEWYSRHSGLSFRDDLCHYVLYGYFGSGPNFFVMGKMIMLEGEPAFFVRFASGRISEGINWIRHLPEGFKWISFCRNDRGSIRKYPIDRLKSLGKIDSLTSPLFSMELKQQSNGQTPVEE